MRLLLRYFLNYVGGFNTSRNLGPLTDDSDDNITDDNGENITGDL